MGRSRGVPRVRAIGPRRVDVRVCDRGDGAEMSAGGSVSTWGARSLAVAVLTAGLLVLAVPARAQAPPGLLKVRITELPAGVPAHVTVSGGQRTIGVVRTTTLRVRPGRYRILVGFARGSHGLRYFPMASSLRVAVRAARTTTVVADYVTIVPPSTRTPSSAAITGISGRAGGSQTLTVRRTTGSGYRVGDVIAAGVSRRAPYGFIARIARVVKRNRSTIVFLVGPATLAQALPRTRIDANVPTAAPARTFQLGCGNSATATISASLSMSLHAQLETGGHRPHLTAASFALTPTAKTGVAVTTADDGTCNATRSTRSDGRPVTVHAGSVPLVLVPRASTRFAIAGSYGSGTAATELQTITGTVRLSYDGGSWRRGAHLVRTVSSHLDDSQPAPGAARQLTATIAATASILLDGLSGPHLDLNDTPSLALTPTASLDLAHATRAVDGLEPVAHPLTDRITARDATILTATEPLAHRTLAALPSGGRGASATQVIAGAGDTCALLQSGRLYCWGGNLGNGQAQSPLPVLVPDLAEVRQVATGGADTCAVLSSGGVDCWGDDREGEIGNGTEQPTPVQEPAGVHGIATAVQVAVGGNHACALLGDGSVECWGSGAYGELGNGQLGISSSVPVAVLGIHTATQISAGGRHTCALLADQTVTCWGFESRLDRFGDAQDSAVPVSVDGVTHATQVSAGATHACALLTIGVVLCWGDDETGELGNGHTAPYAVPVAVGLASQVRQVSAGDGQTCALLQDGTINCWGAGTAPFVADGVSTLPVQVPGIATAVRLSAGTQHACAVLRDGTVDCWGDIDSGALGNGSPDVSIDLGNGAQFYVNTARTVNLAGVSQITAGGEQRCAVLKDGGTDCWGLNDQLELGLPATTEHAVSPVAVPALTSKIATQISAGTWFSPSEDHTCARLQDGTVACWGADDAGQLGNGLHPASADPVLVNGVTTAVQVSAGGEHSCAVLLDGTVTCWGRNDSGQLGDGTTSPSATPVQVSGITTAVQVAAGDLHTCALLKDGTVKCWGDDGDGELGNGHAGNGQSSSLPVAAEIFPTHPATEISAGGFDTCVLMQDHTINCWGQADHGQLGNGVKFPEDSSPVRVSNIGDATDVSVGQDHACDVGAGGRVSCWGSDLNGQLGNATHVAAADIDAPTPVDVLHVAGARQVSAGVGTTCATLTDGTAACWGAGSLGDATSNSPLSPVSVVGLPES